MISPFFIAFATVISPPWETGINPKTKTEPALPIFSEETLSSFEGKPITDDHPQEQVTSDNFQIYAKGNIKNVQRGSGEYKDFILADLVIWDKELVNKIEKEILQTTSVIPFIIENAVSPHPFNKERGA